MIFNTIFLFTGNSTTDFVIAVLMCLVPFALGWLAAQAYYKVSFLRERVTTLEAEVAKLNGKVSGLNEDLTQNRVKLTQADADLHDKNMRISSLKNQLIIMEDERNKLQEQLNGDESESASRGSRNAGAKKDSGEKTTLVAALTSEPEGKTTSRAAANMEPVLFGGVRYQPNDLKIVEGIGPKIDELLRAEGIVTWKQLAETPTDRLQEILNAGGPNFNTQNPGTWAEQARMADNGNWEELKKYQESLDAGRS